MATKCGIVPAVNLRTARFEDYDQIAFLSGRYGLGARSEDQWRHLWVNNPEYKREPGWPIGWVIEAGPRIVGYLGNIPLACELDGRKLVTARGRSWVVDHKYRSLAPLLMDRYFSQGHIDLFLNTTVNRHAEEPFKTFGSLRVPRGQWDSSVFWITNYRGFAKSALTARGWKLAPALSVPAAAALLVADRIRGRSVPAARNAEVRMELGFDERFDVFWQELRRKKRDILLGSRSRETLDWHFRNFLDRKQLYILTLSRGGRLEAYSIFYRKDNEEHRLRRIRLADYQSLEDAPEAYLPMLSRMLDTCRRENVHMLEDIGHCIQAISPPGQRSLPSWMYYFKANLPGLEQRLKQPSAWQPSLFDGDSSL